MHIFELTGMHSSICIALDLFDDRSYHNRINIIQHKLKHESNITDQYKYTGIYLYKTILSPIMQITVQQLLCL